MQDVQDKSILTRNPVVTLAICAVVCTILGFILVFSVVGAIAGIPLLILGAITGYAAHAKKKSIRG